MGYAHVRGFVSLALSQEPERAVRSFVAFVWVDLMAFAEMSRSLAQTDDAVAGVAGFADQQGAMVAKGCVDIVAGVRVGDVDLSPESLAKAAMTRFAVAVSLVLTGGVDIVKGGETAAPVYVHSLAHSSSGLDF